MRYYAITVTPQSASLATTGSTLTINGVTQTFIGSTSTPAPTFSWTSFVNGATDPGALQVEFDFFSATSSTGQPAVATLTIRNIALPDLYEAQKFTGANIVVRAGMQAGLPLANPAQAGVIWNGTINQSFGNWIGTDMTLDFVMYPAVNYTMTKPGQFVLNWPAGTSLQAALTTCLGVAYPTLASPRFAIGSQYVLNYPVLHAVSTFPQLAKYVQSITNSISSPGVFMAINPDNSIHVWDGSAPNPAIQVAFTDLIGQPTWIASNIMQFTTVMRADIQVGAVIQMPTGIGAVGGVTVSAQAFPSQLGPQYKTAFQGQFTVTSARFIGNFKDPAGSSWATVFQCVPIVGNTNG